jgi:hypothetical protein
MIRFSLRCSSGHGFESWFPGNAAFEEQAARGLVECPVCGSAHVEKSIMAPHVARTDRKKAGGDEPSAPVQETAAPAPMPVMTMTPAEKELRELVRKLCRHVEETADPVGPRFADEALKMHLGEIEHRPIYGSATPDDARMLIEEGVPFQPLPILPDDRN